MKVYTRKGDDGTTGLLFGGRVRKDSAAPAAYGDVDETQAHIGLARGLARAGREFSGEAACGDELDAILISLARDLWVLMAELATDPSNHHKLTDGTTRVTAEMVTALEQLIDDVSAKFEPPTEFVVPGESALAAQLDVARTVSRRAERSALGVDGVSAQVLAYLNRLSDLLWTLARWAEGESLTARSDTSDHAADNAAVEPNPTDSEGATTDG